MRIKILFLLLVSLFIFGCGQNLSDEEIEARNAKSRAAVDAELNKTKANTEIKLSGSVIAKKVGGSSTIELPTDTKLQLITWKGDELWFLYRPMRENEKPEVYTYQEDSKWGILEATYKIVESR